MTPIEIIGMALTAAIACFVIGGTGWVLMTGRGK
jgi:hypothetical protein